MAENNTTNNTDSNDEIDLGQLFQMIAKAFNNLFRAFLRLFLYLKKNAIALLVLIVLGAATAFGLKRIISEEMKTEVIVKPNVESRNYLYEVVDEIQSNIEAKDTLFFKALGINVENLKGFEVTAESLGDVVNSKKSTEYLDLLKDFEGSSEAISDIVRAEVLSKSTLINHKVTFFYKDPVIGQEYAEILMAYINSNEHFIGLINIYKENAKERIRKNTELVAQVDGLIASYAKKLGQKDDEISDGKISFTNEEKLDITGLFELKTILIKDIETKKVELITEDQTIKIINFGKPQKVQKAFFGEEIVMIPLVFIGLFFLVSFLFYLNKKATAMEA